MAGKVEKAMMRDAAIGRIEAAMTMLNKRLKVPMVELPTQGNDSDLLMIRRLEAIADFLEGTQFSAVFAPKKPTARRGKKSA